MVLYRAQVPNVVRALNPHRNRQLRPKTTSQNWVCLFDKCLVSLPRECCTLEAPNAHVSKIRRSCEIVGLKSLGSTAL